MAKNKSHSANYPNDRWWPVGEGHVKRTAYALGHEVPHPGYDGGSRSIVAINMHLTRWALMEDRRISAVPVWLGGPDDWSGYE